MPNAARRHGRGTRRGPRRATPSIVRQSRSPRPSGRPILSARVDVSPASSAADGSTTLGMMPPPRRATLRGLNGADGRGGNRQQQRTAAGEAQPSVVEPIQRPNDAPSMTDPTASPPSRLSTIARRPAPPAAGCFIVGIVVHAVPPGAAAAVARVAGRKRRGGPPLVAAKLPAALGLAVAGAAARSSRATSTRGATSACSPPTAAPRAARARVDDPPRVLTNRFETDRPLPPKQVTRATVTRVRTPVGSRRAGPSSCRSPSPTRSSRPGRRSACWACSSVPRAGDEPGAVRLPATTATSGSWRRSRSRRPATSGSSTRPRPASPRRGEQVR